MPKVIASILTSRVFCKNYGCIRNYNYRIQMLVGFYTGPIETGDGALHLFPGKEEIVSHESNI